jgi:hypothetical protein
VARIVTGNPGLPVSDFVDEESSSHSDS